MAFAEGEEAAPPSEPAPAEAPSEPAPVEAPSELTEAPPTEPNLPPALPPGEQPVPPQVPSGPGGEPGSGGQPSEPSSGGEGGSMPPATGPGNGGCWVGENQVLCPGEGQGPNQGMQPQQPGTNFMNPQNIPPGCKQVNNNGMINIVCDNAQRAPEQMTCTPGDVRERIEKECAAKGGRVVTRNIDSSQGCGIVDCVFLPAGNRQLHAW